MPCGCKKNKNVQTTTNPSTVRITEVSTPQQTEISLTEEQIQQVDAIVEKLNQLDETSR